MGEPRNGRQPRVAQPHGRSRFGLLCTLAARLAFMLLPLSFLAGSCPAAARLIPALAPKGCTAAADCDPLPVCAQARKCVNSQCAYTLATAASCPCIDGDIRECTLGSTSGLEHCTASGATTSWGACSPNCSNGELRCSSSGVPQVCSSSAGWQNQASCMGGARCSNGACVSTECVADQGPRCKPGTNVRQTCQNFLWVDAGDCGGQACSNGACVANACNPGESRACAGPDGCGGGTERCEGSPPHWGNCENAQRATCPPGWGPAAFDGCQKGGEVTLLMADHGGDGTLMGTTEIPFDAHGGVVQSETQFSYVDGGCWDGITQDSIDMQCQKQQRRLTQCETGAPKDSCRTGITIHDVGSRCVYFKIKGWTPPVQGTCKRQATQRFVAIRVPPRCSW